MVGRKHILLHAPKMEVGQEKYMMFRINNNQYVDMHQKSKFCLVSVSRAYGMNIKSPNVEIPLEYCV